ncbi:radical SAM protein [Gammaproteobacteria bacterium]|nr:radical SAM protein [Gammaproteobacteria bacterium]
MMNTLIINEIFYSIQGESLSSGMPTVFIRLTGCPLRCQYCDTAYAFTEGSKKNFDEIINEVKKFNCNNITVTGGEPLSQKNTIDLLTLLNDLSYNVSIETSNAISIKNLDNKTTIVLDVKTPASEESDKNIIDNYKYLKHMDQVKFVICDLDDYGWAKDYIFKYNLHEKCTVLFSPSYNQMDIKILAENMLKDNIPARLQTQLHKVIWSDERGK